ncbi:MAG TPA: HD domain-containing protein [Nitrososphaerales archaeon]|nr:HD domain-containing protein [Nitrososphaerales archaeon]
MRRSPATEVRDPVHGYVRLTDAEKDLIDSPFVQRLRRIHQLAGSYLVYPGAVHTRFEHVVGAMHVAGQIGDSLVKEPEMTKEQAEEVRVAALLHDVGHGPFSHMFEEVLPARRQVSHEDVSRRVISETSIREILEGHGLSSKRISSLAVGRLQGGAPFMNEVISGGFSADMMDYLPRDAYFTGVEYGKVDTQRVIDSLHVAQGHLVIDKAAIYAFEALLLARYEMFKAVYFHRTVRAAELMLVHSMNLADEALGLTDLSDLDDFLELTDEVVLNKLTNLEPADEDLRQARLLAEGFRDRKLVKCVFERVLQRKEPIVGKLFADERTRERITSEIASMAGVDPMHVYLDVPTTPSVPYTYSHQTQRSVRLLSGEGARKSVKDLPLDKLPLVGSIAGFMDVLRVYTAPQHRQKVGRATSRFFREQPFASTVEM